MSRISPIGLLVGASLSLGLVSSAMAHGPAAHGETAFGRAGDPGRPTRAIEVRMRDEENGTMIFEPQKITVKQGEQIKFRIKNEGIKDHEFVLATHEDNLKHAAAMKKTPEMEHDEPNMKRLRPNTSTEVLWQFTKAGKFHIGCLIPGHLEAGMEAYVEVEPARAKGK